MSFIVTARKWRPNLFSEVAGQEHITSTLKNAIKSGRIAHAYIFTGPRGVGKTTTARILAKTLNCLNPVDYEPCNSCELCLSIQNNQSMDIIEIDAASNRGIDDIRTLRESVKYAPTRGKYKVYIIDEVHMLTKESFNAFLKTLEEPPSHTIFIFATTDIHKVPLTIISRCQRFDFRRIQIKTIKEQLAKIAAADGIEIDDLTLTTIARKADGALRDAESFFDQIVSFCGNKIDAETVAQMLNQIDDEIYFTISDAILDKNFKAVFDVSDEMYAHGYDFIELLNGLSDHFRNILTVVITGKTAFLETAQAFKNKYLDYYGKFTQGDLLRILNFLNKTSQEMRYSQNHRLKIEISLSHLIGLEKSLTISEVLSNLDNLDQVLEEPEKKNDNPTYPIGVEDSSRVKAAFVADAHLQQPNPKTSAKLTETSSIANKITDHSNSGSDNLKNNGSPKAETKLPGSSSIPPSSKLNDEKKNVAHELKSNGELSFEIIKQKWDNFVSIVAAEKKLTLGTYIKHSVLAGFEGNKIKLELDDEHGRKSFQYDNDYLLKKSLEIFGKKLSFVFIDNLTKKEHSPVRKLSEKKEDDPIINLILTELGGEEIS